MTALLDESLSNETRLREALLREEFVDEELLAKRKQIMASRTKEEWAELMNQVNERASKKSYEEFKRQTMEVYKQSDRYKEYLKRRQAEKDGG